MIFVLILCVMFAPPIIFLVLGRKARPDKKKAKMFYIIAAVYLLVGLGTCATILTNLSIH